MPQCTCTSTTQCRCVEWWTCWAGSSASPRCTTGRAATLPPGSGVAPGQMQQKDCKGQVFSGQLPAQEPLPRICRNDKTRSSQTVNRRSEDVEGEKAPGNKQQKHRFVVSTDVFCRRLQCIYGAATRMMCSCVHVSSAAPSHHHHHRHRHRITCSSTTIYRQACSRGGRR